MQSPGVIVTSALRLILSKTLSSLAASSSVGGLMDLHRNLAHAMGTFFGTHLTLEEEEILAAVLNEWLQSDSQDALAIAAKMTRRSSSAVAVDGGEWSEAGNSLLQQMAQVEHGELFVYWAAGVQVRAKFVKNALSASAGRFAEGQIASHKKQIESLEPELAGLQAENKRLSSKNTELEKSLQQKQASIAVTRSLIEEATAPDVSAEVEGSITNILTGLKAAQLLTGAGIPTKKMINARNSCAVPNSDKILGLIDLTLFGSAKDAVVFGGKALYFRINNSPIALRYSELRNYDMVCNLNDVTFSHRTNGISIKTSWTQSTGKVVMDAAKAIQASTLTGN